MNGRNASRPGWPLNRSSGRGVGGRHHHHRAVEQRLEQPAEDHRIGDVVDLELVEAQQRRFGGDRIGQRRDRVLALRVGPLPGMNAAVRVLHEAVEMNAPLALDLGRGEKQVHQHRLAAADLADQIQPAATVLVRPIGLLAAGKRPSSPGIRRRPGHRVVAAQLDPQFLQPLRCPFLRRIGREIAGVAAGAIDRQRPQRQQCRVNGKSIHGRAG